MKQAIWSLSVVLLVVLSGCPVLEESGGIITFSGNLNASADGFHLNGEVENTGQVQPSEISRATIYLYAPNETVIASKQAKLDTKVSMQTTTAPEYIIINSPQFWQFDDITVNYYKRIPDEDIDYSPYSVGSRDEFPVEVPPQTTSES